MFTRLCFWMEGLLIGIFSMACFLKGKHFLGGLILGIALALIILLGKKFQTLRIFWLDGFAYGVVSALLVGKGYILAGALIYLFGSLLAFWVANRPRFWAWR